jgi:Polyketide cyclase / dehydrase and lipid transport.
MLKKILIAVAVVVLVFVVIVATRPADFRVTRSASFAAPPEAVFAQINNFHNWDAWSPWSKLDPNAKFTFEGPEAGVGAAFAWAGNNQVGEGRMTIAESRTNELIRLKMEFFKPVAGVSTTEFTFKPEGDQTTVTWSMFGKNNFMAKAVTLFMDCDNLIGSQFEKGLANLRTVVETNAAK